LTGIFTKTLHDKRSPLGYSENPEALQLAQGVVRGNPD
jgi:hypothetical protein